MATSHSAPIDLYEESREGFATEEGATTAQPTTEDQRPAFNGDRDEPAIAAGQGRLEQVLGW